MIRGTVAGDFGRFDYAATGNKVVGCAWLTSLLLLGNNDTKPSLRKTKSRLDIRR